jgi:tetratricopeptide (TPR) repeat protein
MMALSTVKQMISIFLFNFVLIYSFGVSQTNTELQHLKYVEHLDQGIMLMFQGNTPKALDELEKALEIESNHYEVHHYLSMAYEEDRRWNSVVLATTKSLELKSDNIEALYSRGKALFNLGKWEEASKTLKKAVDYAPKHARALKTLGKAQIQRRQFVEISLVKVCHT